jgi:hypothetical protein
MQVINKIATTPSSLNPRTNGVPLKEDSVIINIIENSPYKKGTVNVTQSVVVEMYTRR